MLLIQVLFWICFYGILHTYIIYPQLLKILDKITINKPQTIYSKNYFPKVTILMSVYNEAEVILKKLESIESTTYPKEKLSVFIGSDCSEDDSNLIISKFINNKNNYHFYPYSDRSGKIGVIQRLVKELTVTQPLFDQHIFLFTDANVLLEENTIPNLMRHFTNDKIALVDTNMINLGINEKGISKAEETYIAGEVMLKHREGKLWGCMMGAFGGCFAIRSTYYVPVPRNFIVDDFFLTLAAMQKGGLIINDLDAKCYEAIPNDMWEEYKRKKRISSGNYQNLNYFKSILFNKPFTRAFAFLSHKVLRWITPVLLLIGFISLIYLSNRYNGNYRYLLVLWSVILLVIPLLDMLLHKFNIHIAAIRKIRYFVFMNIALFHGLIKYINGIKSNVWQPPKRKSID